MMIDNTYNSAVVQASWRGEEVQEQVVIAKDKKASRLYEGSARSVVAAPNSTRADAREDTALDTRAVGEVGLVARNKLENAAESSSTSRQEVSDQWKHHHAGHTEANELMQSMDRASTSSVNVAKQAAVRHVAASREAGMSRVELRSSPALVTQNKLEHAAQSRSLSKPEVAAQSSTLNMCELHRCTWSPP